MCQALVVVVEGDVRVRVEEGQSVACDDSLDGRVVDEVWPEILHYAGVQNAARQVLGAGLCAPLDDKDLVSGPGELVSRDAAGDPGSDHDDVEIHRGGA